MTITQKTTIHDVAWDVAENQLPDDGFALSAYLVVAGVPVTDETLDYATRRVRIEKARRGQWGAQ